MTATTTTPSRIAERDAGPGPLPGFGGLLRKELTEWRRARRSWVVLLVAGLFMTLSALNAWLQTALPADVTEGAEVPSFEPMVILAGAIGAEIFAVAAIFAVMGLLVGERENGTLAWMASKPVSRSSIWLAKLTAAVGVLWIVAVAVPVIATVALIAILYGGVEPVPTLIMAAGAGLSVILYVVIALAASTVVTSQAAVAAIAIAAMFLPQLLGLIVSAEFLPTSILAWTMHVAAGAPVGLITPLVWAATVVILSTFALRRIEAMEL